MFTPKRLIITGVTVALIAGFTTFLVNTAIENSKVVATPLDVLGFDPDIIGNDPRMDALKANAASAMQEKNLEGGRAGRKAFGPDDSVEIPKEAPGGGGFLPADFPAGTNPDPGSNKALGKQMNAAMGWESEWGCLEKLWDKESHWNERAMNRSSGAYGIPQSLPGSKMATAGSDWQINPATQIKWGLGYIKGRYGSPCGAWGHSQRVGWY